ncbi:MAG: hypothetical protein RJA36_1834, partial [Pseudomonadota bacterium]
SAKAAQEALAKATVAQAQAQREAAATIAEENRARAAAQASQQAFLNGLREQIALYGKSADEVARYKAAQLGVGAAAAPLLLQLQNQRAAQEQAAAAAREEAQAQQQAAAAKKSAEAAAKSFITSLREQVALQGKSQAEILRYRAAQLGVAGDAEKYIKAIDAANAGTSRLGVSAGQTTAALRQLPAQFTDIATQLAGGSNPFLVLLQQGGQIKDSFGGIGNAARALVGSITPVGAALTGLAAAVAVVGLGLFKATSELTAYRQALVLTGNAAGATVGSLVQAQQAIAAGVGTQGKAAEVLAALASTGRVAAKDLQQLAEAAIRLEREGGPAVEETVKAFAELGRSPTQGAAKLNEQTRFLTVSVFEQIKALEEQGKTAEAASLAQQEFARVSIERAKELADSASGVEKAWKGVKDLFKGLVDAPASLFRPPGADAAVAIARQSLEAAKAERAAIGEGGGSRAQFLDADIRRLEAYIAKANEATKATADLAKSQADASRASLAGQEFAALESSTKSPQAKLAEQLAKIAEKGAEAGLSLDRITEAQKRATAASEAYGLSVQEQTAKIQAAAAVRQEVVARQVQDAQALREQGALSEIDLIKRVAQIQAQAARDEARDIRATAAAQAGKLNSRAELIQLAGQAAAAEQRAAAIEQKAIDDTIAAIRKKELAVLSLVLAWKEEQAAEQGRDLQQIDQQRLAAANAVREYARAIDESAERTTLEASLIGQSNAVRERQLALFDVEIKRRQQIRAIQDNTALGPDDRERETRLVNEAAVRERTRVETQVALDEWKKTNDQIAQSLTDALIEGGRSFRDYLVSLMRTTVLRPIIQAVFAPFAAGLTTAAQAFTGGGQGTQIGANGQPIFQAASLFNAGKSIYEGFASSFSTVGLGVANAYGTTIANATATGLDGFLATNNAFGTAGGAGGTGTAIGSVASAAAGAAVGVFGGRAISGGYSAFGGNSGNSAVNTGTVVGGIVGSIVPVIGTALGAAVGGIIGGVVNRLFGRKAPQVESQFIEGTISGGGDFSGGVTTNILEKGGLFRSDKRSSTTDAITGDLDKSLDAGAAKLVELAKKYGDALGLPVDQLANVSTAIKVQVTDDLTKNTEAVTAALQQFADSLLGAFADEVEPFRQAGETVAQVIERVGGNLLQINSVLEQLGLSALATSVDGGKAALALSDLFGGAGNFAQVAANYYQKFYSEAERADAATAQITETLSKFGLELPKSRDGFRALVDAQDLTTASGREAFAALLGVADAFDAIQTSGAAAAEELARVQKEREDKRTGELSRLEDELLRLQGNTVEIRNRERAALEESNRALYDQIQALKDQAAELEKQKRLQGSIDSGLESFLSPEALRRQRAQRISDNLSGIGGNLSADELLGLSRQQIFDMAAAFVQLTIVSTDAKQVVVDAAVALERLVRSAEEAARAAAIDDLQKKISDLESVFGDLSVVNRVETVSEAYQRNVAELENLQAGFDNLLGNIGKTVQETLADLLNSQKALQGYRAQLRGTIDETYLRTLSPSARIASLKSKESALFGQLGTAADPVSVAQELQRTILQRIKEEAALREASLSVEIELTKKARDAQIAALRGQIDGFQRLRELAQQMGQFTNSLRFSDVSPLSFGDQLGTARSLFEDTLRRAQGGDAFAVSNLQGNARAYLDEARAYFASSAEYAAIFAEVTGALDAISAGGADSQIAPLEAQLAELQALNQTTIDTSAEELAALQAIDAALAAREAENTKAIEEQKKLAQAQIDKLTALVEDQKARLTQAAAEHRELLDELRAINENTAALIDGVSLESGAPGGSGRPSAD